MLGASAQRCVHSAIPLCLLTEHSQTRCCCERGVGQCKPQMLQEQAYLKQ